MARRYALVSTADAQDDAPLTPAPTPVPYDLSGITAAVLFFFSRAVRILALTFVVFGIAMRTNTSAGCSYETFVSDMRASSAVNWSRGPYTQAVDPAHDLCPVNMVYITSYYILAIVWIIIGMILVRPIETILARWFGAQHTGFDMRVRDLASTIVMVLVIPYAIVVFLYIIGYAVMFGNNAPVCPDSTPPDEDITPLNLYEHTGAGGNMSAITTFLFVYTLILWVFYIVCEISSSVMLFPYFIKGGVAHYNTSNGWINLLTQENTLWTRRTRIDMYTITSTINNSAHADLLVETTDTRNITYEKPHTGMLGAVVGVLVRIFMTYIVPFVIVIVLVSMNTCPTAFRTPDVTSTGCAPVWVSMSSYVVAAYIVSVTMERGVLQLLAYMMRPTIPIMGMRMFWSRAPIKRPTAYITWILSFIAATFVAVVFFVYTLVLFMHAGAATGVWVPIDMTTHPFASISWTIMICIASAVAALLSTATELYVVPTPDDQRGNGDSSLSVHPHVEQRHGTGPRIPAPTRLEEMSSA